MTRSGLRQRADRTTSEPAPDGAGLVRTQRVVVATHDDPLALTCGRTLDHVEVAYETYGELDATASNAVYLCHALTADAHAAGVDPGTGAVGWWDDLVGPGRPLDTDRFFVVCGNLLGSCRGTTGPASTDLATGRPYGLGFPPISIADQVAVHRRLCASLGIRRLHAIVGPSLGGMQALQWFLDAAEEVDRTILIASTGRLSTENRAFSAAGRQAILDDPGFDGGRYLERGGPGPRRGLAAARRFAHITYVSGESLEAKLGDDAPEDWPPQDATAWLAPSREVERYLDHQGTAFLDRFDALSYLYLTRPMDDFDPFRPSRAAVVREAVASNPAARHTVLSFDSDWRFGSDHGRRLAEQLLAAGAAAATHEELAAPWGHDSFLKGSAAMADRIEAALSA